MFVVERLSDEERYIENADYYASVCRARVTATGQKGWMASAYGFGLFIGNSEVSDDKAAAKDDGRRMIAKAMESDRKFMNDQASRRKEAHR